MKNPFLILFVFCGVSLVSAQQKTIDSLFLELNTHQKESIERVDLLNELAYLYSKSKPDSIIYFSEKARAIAKKIDYPNGIAASQKSEAIYHYYQGNIDLCFQNLNEAISIYKKTNNLKGLANVYNNYGLVLNSYGDFQQSAIKYEEAFRINQQLKDTTSLIRNLVNLANNKSNQADYDIAREHYNKALSLAIITKDLEQQANVYNGKAIVFERTGKFNEAKESILEARKIYEELGLPANLFITYNNIANINRKQAEFAEAIKNFQIALDFAKQINNKRYQGIVLNNIASCWLDLGDNEKALKMYEESVAISEPIDKRTYMAGISNIAIIYSSYKDDVEKLDHAIELLEKVEKHFITQNSKNELSNTYNNIADVYLTKKDTITAKRYLEKAQEIGEENANKYNLSATYTQLAQLYAFEKEWKKSIELALKSYQLAEEMETLNSVLSSAEILVNAYEATGNYKQALFYQKRIDDVAKELFNEEKSKEIGKLEAEIEFKAIEEEIRLENEKELLQKQVSLRRQELLSMLFGVGIVALFIIVLLLIKIRRNEQNTNKILQQSREKIEKQNKELRELHNQKNKLFSIISHDLRGPLKTLKSFFEMALKDEISDEELKAMVPEINQNLERTIVLTDNLLNWSSKLMKQQQSEKSKVSILKAINDVEALFQASINKKNLVFNKNVDENLNVIAVENSIELILRNLISNSIKFSDEKGEINIYAERKAAFVKVCILDNGVGMSQEQANKVFHGELNSIIGTNNEKGAGIGLLLCKDFVEENGGEIWVESTEIKKGTKICFTVPSLKKSKKLPN